MKKLFSLIVSTLVCASIFGTQSAVPDMTVNEAPRFSVVHPIEPTRQMPIVKSEVSKSAALRHARPSMSIVKAAAATAQTISFSEVITAADFGTSRTFGSGDFTLTVTNELGTKASVDYSTGRFVTSAADYQSFSYRLKTGGASKTTAGEALGMQLYIPADGMVTVYARSGNSAASRGLVAVQNGETLFAHTYSDGEAFTDVYTIYPKYSFAAQAGTVDLLFEDGAMYIYAFDYTPQTLYSHTIRVRKGDACAMDVSNGLWLWWWSETDAGGCASTTYSDGWYSATIMTSSQTMSCLAVNTDVSNGWADAVQTVDYANIIGDVCLEIGATTDTYGKYDIYATDCQSVSTPLTPSFDFTQAIVKDYDASGFTNNYDIYFCTADYDESGIAVKGTRLYLYAYAKSMTSLVGTFAVNGLSSIGDVYRAELYYGDGDTEAEITLSSGYVTITLDEKGNYLLSYELTDTNGNTYTEAGRIIAEANVIGYNTQTGTSYTLTNEKVSAALSASEALTMTANLSHTNLTTMSYFVEGLTSNRRNTADKVAGYGTNRFDISDDATTTNQFYSFNTKWLGNTSYTAEVSNYPQIGDRVVVFGPVQKYNGTTPEIRGYIYECSLTASCALSNLQATSTDGYNYTFSWENTPYPASAYTLLVYDSNGAQVYSESITTRNLNIEFTESGNYTWAVRAEDSNGNVLNTAEGAIFTVTTPGVNYTPYNLQGSSANGNISLLWSADDGDLFLVVFNWVSNGQEGTHSTYTNTTSLSISVTGFSGEEMNWKVATVDENGNLLSDYVQGPAFIVPENPYQLLNLQASSTDGYNYTFSWEYLTSQADKYIVYIYDSNDNLYKQLTTTTTSAAHTFAEEGTYYWVVYAYDETDGGLGFANGGSFDVTLPTTYSFTITTTVSDNCTMDFSNGMWYYWWTDTESGSVQAWQNNEGKYVATIEAPSESIGCLVANADPLTEGWDSLQQTEDSPTLYGDTCLLIGNEGWYGKWNLESRPCDEDLSIYLPYDLQVTTGVGTADFSWTATKYEQFEVLLNHVETPNSVDRYVVDVPALGLLFNNNAVGKWQWRVRALSNNGAALTAFVEGPEFEIKENPYLPYNLKATTQDSATYYLSWDADVQAPQYLVSVGNGFYEYVTTQPVEVTFTQEGWFYWRVTPCDENRNELGFVYGESIYVPAHAVPDYSVTDLQVQTIGTTTTATWKSTWDNFAVRLFDRSTWNYDEYTTANTYYQWENLAAGDYYVDIYPLDVNGSYVSDAVVGVYFTVEETTEPTTQYYISISAGPNGSVNSSKINGYYDAGTVLNLVATPDEGYRFVQWSDGNLQADRSLVLMQDTFLTASFELIPQVVEYTVTVNGADGGTTNLYGTHTYEANTAITLLATPEEGYEFTVWKLDIGDTFADNPLFYTVTENVIITPVFTKKAPEPTYTLTVNTTGQGWVTISPEQETYQSGAMVVLTAIPAEGWQFKQWEDGSISATRYLTMTENKEVTATFEEIPEEPEPTTYYTLTMNTVGQGSITASPQASQYEAGSTVILTATPAEGWQFKEWEDGSISATRYLTMTENKEVTATFEEIPEEPEPTTYYTLTMNTVGQGSVTASPQANQYKAGSTVILTATPAEGWQFKQWEDNTTNAIRSITMDANKVVMAIFEEAPEYAVQSLNVSVTKQTAKATWTSGAPFFEVKVTNKKGVEQASDTISAKTYTFKGSQGQTYTIAVRPMEADKQTYLANATTKSFTLERLYNVYISALSGGTVNDEEVNGDYEYGTEITIVATPKAGYRFKKWSDDNTQATRKITIEEDVYLEASFSRIPTYTVTVFEVTGGTTTLVGDTTLMEGENLTIKATPEEGYIFSQWLVNGEVNTDNPFVITAIDQDYYIEPVFIKEEMGVEQTTIDNAAQKYMVNGVLYIRRGENVYDAQGKRVEQ